MTDGKDEKVVVTGDAKESESAKALLDALLSGDITTFHELLNASRPSVINKMLQLTAKITFKVNNYTVGNGFEGLTGLMIVAGMCDDKDFGKILAAANGDVLAELVKQEDKQKYGYSTLIILRAHMKFPETVLNFLYKVGDSMNLTPYFTGQIAAFRTHPTDSKLTDKALEAIERVMVNICALAENPGKMFLANSPWVMKYLSTTIGSEHPLSQHEKRIIMLQKILKALLEQEQKETSNEKKASWLKDSDILKARLAYVYMSMADKLISEEAALDSNSKKIKQTEAEKYRKLAYETVISISNPENVASKKLARAFVIILHSAENSEKEENSKLRKKYLELAGIDEKDSFYKAMMDQDLSENSRVRIYDTSISHSFT